MSKHTLSLDQYTLPLTVTRESGDFYVASCPVWSDCFAQGASIEEALYEVKQVAISLIGLYQEEGLAVPLKKTVSKSNPTKMDISVDVFSPRYA